MGPWNRSYGWGMSGLERIRRDGRWLRSERLLAGAVTLAVVAFAASGSGSGATGPAAGEAPRITSRTEIADGGARPAVSGSRVAYLDVRTQGLGVRDCRSNRDLTGVTLVLVELGR